jgi:hypothetical protein
MKGMIFVGLRRNRDEIGTFLEAVESKSSTFISFRSTRGGLQNDAGLSPRSLQITPRAASMKSYGLLAVKAAR